MAHADVAAAPVAPPADLFSAGALQARYGALTAPEILDAAINTVFAGRIALVSSFGADAAALLHLVSEVNPATPVLFLETGKHFPETLRYRDRLIARLGLTDVRSLRPDPVRLTEIDPEGALWLRNTDQCCHIRKVEPLARAMEGFDAWITGRKRFQNGQRAQLTAFETEGGRVKVNPLAAWTKDDVKAYVARHDLPPHPLVAEGYLSIGCLPCTSRVAAGEDERSGRWRGKAKTECGIHLGILGREIDGSGI